MVTAHIRTRPIRPLRGALVAVAVLLLAGAAASPAAAASVADEQREGAAILRAFESGERSCKDLDESGFERIGEHVMGRMAGSTARHADMNELMARMMGDAGEERAHVFMGRSFTGCGERSGAGFAGMMGIMGMMGGAGGYGPTGMMGGTLARADGDGDPDGGAIAMVVLMGLLLVAAAAAMVAWKPWRRPEAPSPLDLLRERYARGEIGLEEFESRRRALGGTA